MKKEVPICIVCKTGNKNNEYFYNHIGIYAWDSFLICKKCLKLYNKIFFNDNNNLIKQFKKESLLPYILKANKTQLINYPKNYKKVGVSKIFNGTKKAIKMYSKIKHINAFNWRIYAKRELSEVYNPREHTTFYLFIFYFLMVISYAYENQDFKLVKRIFKFANKCCKSKSWYISNAIDVSFYEHLTDHPNLKQNLRLISKSIIKNEVIPLTKWMRPNNYKKLMFVIKKNKIIS